MDYKERLLCELLDLSRKRELLKRTLDGDVSNSDKRAVELLQQQLEAMSKYEEILYVRVLELMK